MTEEQKQSYLLSYRETLREMEVALDLSQYRESYESNLLKIANEPHEESRQMLGNANAFLVELMSTWTQNLNDIRARIDLIEGITAADLTSEILDAISKGQIV